MAKAFSLFSNHKRTLLVLIFLSAFSLTIVYAAPRTESYAPGDTLDPDCAPGEDFCSVEIPTGGTSSPITIENTNSLFSTGLTGTGVGSDAQHAIFLGEDAGNGATNVSFSNFLGRYAGKDAIGSYNANFLGYGAGQGAENTHDSNFFGIYAGTGATDAFNANFLGYLAGQDATNTHDSNFLGANAGNGAIDSSDSNFFGNNAGLNATNASYSNFFGNSAGANAINASGSNFFGANAGQGAEDASNSNFFGNNTATGASNAQHSNFFGTEAGGAAINASHSNFFGSNTGNNAINAQYSNFFGTSAGEGAENASNSNFFGQNAGKGAVNTSYSNLFGYNVGYNPGSNNIGANNIIIGTNISLPNATANAINLGGVLFGTGTYSTTTGNPSITPISGGRIGIGVVSPAYTLDVNGAAQVSGNLIIGGTCTGCLPSQTSNSGKYLTTDGTTASWGSALTVNTVNSSIYSSALSSLSVSNSNFLGLNAGQNATNATNSNFFGRLAGGGTATNASNSNFLGFGAGRNATNASNSNFFGQFAGDQSASAVYSNFFGNSAGREATNASYSNFFGEYAGWGQTNASLSTFIGMQAGYYDTVTSNNLLGSNNIIIGTNISLPNATANAINIGGVLFGTGTFSNISVAPSVTPISGGRIGIGVVSPSYTLQVGNSGVSGIVARFENSAGTCDINPTSASLSCSSDETLKKDIVAVDDDMLEKILSLQPVTYHWNSEDESSDTHIGFIAQQVEEVFPDLVTTDRQTGLKSLNYTGLIPYTVKAIQEMNIQIKTIADIDTPNSLRESLIAWLGSVTNGIEHIFSTKITTKEFCVQDDTGETCLTRSQIDVLLGGQQSNGGSSTDEPVPDPMIETPIDDSIPPSEEISPEPEPETPVEEPVVDEPAPDITTPAE